MLHVYFAFRPEKLWLTRSMVLGWITRGEYAEQHDPARWRIAAPEQAERRRGTAESGGLGD
jgi:hypothetical protein